MKVRPQSRRVSRHGGAVLTVVIGLVLVSIMGASMAGLLYRSGQGHSQSYDIVRARYLAESGISYARTFERMIKLADNGDSETIVMGAHEQFTISSTLSNGLYRVVSIGSTGIGTGRETHQLVTRARLRELDWDPDLSPPEVEAAPVASVADDFNALSLPNWTVTKAVGDFAGFEQIRISPAGGGNNGLIRTDMSALKFMTQDPEQKQHFIGHQNLLLDRRATLEEAWKTNSYQLSYEVQVKMLWYTFRRYGAQGLAVLLKSKDNDLTKGETEGYYVSLMRYHDEFEVGAYNSTSSYDYDGIPNSIKPPGLAGRRLLVLWNQWNSGNDREWLAYKVLDHYSGLPGEDTVDWAVDYNDGFSGQGFKDFATIAVRVIEADADHKYRYLQVLRADPKTGVMRGANTVGEDINRNRKAYLPQLLGGEFPLWSPINYNEWDPEHDYFTLQATLSDDPLEQITWDGFNSDPHANVILMPDKGTIRSEDFKTPDSGDWKPELYEIGLHVTGNLNDILDNEMYFDEFAMRYFINKPFGYGVSGVQY